MPSQKTVDFPLRSIFLKEFVRQLVINSTPKISASDIILERVKKRLANPEEEYEKYFDEEMPKLSPLPNIIKPIALSVRREPPAHLNLPRPRPLPVLKPIRSIIHTPLPKQQVETQTPAQPIAANFTSLSKIYQILRDPSVISLECPGAGKSLFVNRSGLIQTTPISLTEEEIEGILQEFSEKTKIPLLTGIFKALSENIMLTAVISDVVGNRFIIDKSFGKPELPHQENA